MPFGILQDVGARRGVEGYEGNVAVGSFPLLPQDQQT